MRGAEAMLEAPRRENVSSVILTVSYLCINGSSVFIITDYQLRKLEKDSLSPASPSDVYCLNKHNKLLLQIQDKFDLVH